MKKYRHSFTKEFGLDRIVDEIQHIQTETEGVDGDPVEELLDVALQLYDKVQTQRKLIRLLLAMDGRLEEEMVNLWNTYLSGFPEGSLEAVDRLPKAYEDRKTLFRLIEEVVDGERVEEIEPPPDATPGETAEYARKWLDNHS